MQVQHLIRDVPDFPKPGIVFKDITPLLGDARALRHAITVLADAYRSAGITKVVGIESRGFIFAPAIALELGAGFVPIRKPGKLPWKALRRSYDLEYGSDTIEIHADSLQSDDRVLMVDDVLATGGTMVAAIALVQSIPSQVVGTAFLVDLAFLGGSARLGVPITALLTYS